METASRIDLQVVEALHRAGLAVVPDYLPATEWRALAAETARLRSHGAFRHAGVGRGAHLRVRPEIRNDRVLWIDPACATRRQRAWLARMEALRRALNERLFLGLFDLETHLAAYPPGSFYRTHRDRFDDAPHRAVTVLLYLNEDWREEEGGALRLYLEEADRSPSRDVLPMGGTLVAFLAGDFAHEVLPAHRERLSVVGWFTLRR